jgi:hypothetical protein
MLFGVGAIHSGLFTLSVSFFPPLLCFVGRQEGTYYSSILEFLREWCFTDSHFLSRATY